MHRGQKRADKAEGLRKGPALTPRPSSLTQSDRVKHQTFRALVPEPRLS